MGQVTLYLDDKNEKRLRALAKAAGVPMSRWVANLIQKPSGAVWPESVYELAGTWQDFPDAETLRKTEGGNPTREAV